MISTTVPWLPSWPLVMKPSAFRLLSRGSTRYDVLAASEPTKLAGFRDLNIVTPPTHGGSLVRSTAPPSGSPASNPGRT